MATEQALLGTQLKNKQTSADFAKHKPSATWVKIDTNKNQIFPFIGIWSRF